MCRRFIAALPLMILLGAVGTVVAKTQPLSGAIPDQHSQDQGDDRGNNQGENDQGDDNGQHKDRGHHYGESRRNDDQDDQGDDNGRHKDRGHHSSGGGTNGGTGSSVSVPEPATVALLALGLLGCAVRARSR